MEKITQSKTIRLQNLRLFLDDIGRLESFLLTLFPAVQAKTDKFKLGSIAELSNLPNLTTFKGDITISLGTLEGKYETFSEAIEINFSRMWAEIRVKDADNPTSIGSAFKIYEYLKQYETFWGRYIWVPFGLLAIVDIILAVAFPATTWWRAAFDWASPAFMILMGWSWVKGKSSVLVRHVRIYPYERPQHGLFSPTFRKFALTITTTIIGAVASALITWYLTKPSH